MVPRDRNRRRNPLEKKKNNNKNPYDKRCSRWIIIIIIPTTREAEKCARFSPRPPSTPAGSTCRFHGRLASSRCARPIARDIVFTCERARTSDRRCDVIARPPPGTRGDQRCPGPQQPGRCLRRPRTIIIVLLGNGARVTDSERERRAKRS